MKVFHPMQIPPKVTAMYESVIEIIDEGTDIHNIKVESITKRAGIGKGTAYEYFSSKEEIILNALIYDTKKQLALMYSLQEEKESFEDKIKVILEWLREKFKGRCVFHQLMQLWTGSHDMGKAIHENIVKMQEDSSGYLEFIDYLLDVGISQGVIQVTDPYRGRSAIASQFVSYVLYLTNGRFYTTVDEHEALHVAYENMMKMLN